LHFCSAIHLGAGCLQQKPPGRLYLAPSVHWPHVCTFAPGWAACVLSRLTLRLTAPFGTVHALAPGALAAPLHLCTWVGGLCVEPSDIMVMSFPHLVPEVARISASACELQHLICGGTAAQAGGVATKLSGTQSLTGAGNNSWRYRGKHLSALLWGLRGCCAQPFCGYAGLVCRPFDELAGAKRVLRAWASVFCRAGTFPLVSPHAQLPHWSCRGPGFHGF
jgi:hypothetical protein